MTHVKICGITEPQSLQACIDSGTRFVGFVFYEPSPRFVQTNTAWTLSQMLPTGVRSVGLFVDPDDVYINHITSTVALDMIQLHGNETPERVLQIKSYSKMPVIKAIDVAVSSDLDCIADYESIADWLLFDTKTKGQSGGHGQVFDWTLLQNKTFQCPWMLSGGLNSQNIQQALSVLKPDAVDVSSGVEESRGIKSPKKITEFLNTVKSIG